MHGEIKIHVEENDREYGKEFFSVGAALLSGTPRSFGEEYYFIEFKSRSEALKKLKQLCDILEAVDRQRP